MRTVFLAAVALRAASLQGGQPPSLASAARPAPPLPARAQPSAARDPDAPAARGVVEAYCAALERGDVREAYRFWASASAPPARTLSAFRRQVAGRPRARCRVGEPGRVEGAAGSRYVTIPVRLPTAAAHGTDRWDALVLRRSVVPGATAAERAWHLERVDVAPAPPRPGAGHPDAASRTSPRAAAPPSDAAPPPPRLTIVRPPPDVPGVVTLRSPYAAPAVLDRLAALAVAHGLTVFARIEFARDAAAAGLALPPMAQLIFGNPRGGTPVLAAAPLAGLELPLRALAWTDADGQAWLSYPDPRALQVGFGLADAVVAGLQGIHGLCRAAVAPAP